MRKLTETHCFEFYAESAEHCQAAIEKRKESLRKSREWWKKKRGEK